MTDRNVLLLTACQALFWSALMIGITMSGLVGLMLAENRALATLPVGLLAFTTIFVARPAGQFMQRFGRRAGFAVGAAAGVAGGLISVWGIFAASFAVFCLGNAVLGIYQGIGQFYRLAATDTVDPERRGRAVSTVMAGGIVAAVAAPNLTIWTKDLFAPVVFAGSFAAVAALAIAATALIVFLAEPAPTTAASGAGAGRPLAVILRQPRFIVALANAAVAHGIMILVMIATPLAMVGSHFGVADAAVVIQWHVFGMFVPSFFSGRLIDRFGAPNVAIAGAIVLAASAGVAAGGGEFGYFGVALTLLGVGWNLMYVAGTTMVTASHLPEERGRVQGTAETIIATVAAAASFASAAVLNSLGWTVVNLAATPIIAAVIVLNLWYLRTAGRATAPA